MTTNQNKSKLATGLSILFFISGCSTCLLFFSRCRQWNADQRRVEEQRESGENADDLAKRVGLEKHAERIRRQQELLREKAAESDSEPDADAFMGTALEIIDGDTFELLVGNEQFRVRLEGVDCPELGGGQPFCARAKQGLSDLIYGKRVHVKATGTDRYGQTLGRVFVDGTDVNRALLAQGLAWVSVESSDDESLSAVESGAKAAGAGLWADANPIPPWDWRNGERP